MDTNKPLYLVYEWDLTKNEIEKIEAAECGNSVTIETSPFPAVFPDDTDKTWYLFSFDSTEKITDDFLCKYAIQEHSLDVVLAIMKVFYDLRHKNIILVVNPDDECPEFITMEEFEKLVKTSNDM